ncbi:MAG: hypothetical protein ACW98D_20160, partial [Promethearchaeota archaeon]
MALPRGEFDENVYGTVSKSGGTGDDEATQYAWVGNDYEVQNDPTVRWGFKPTVFDKNYIIKGDKYRYAFNIADSEPAEPIYKIRNDNSKYTIFVREGVNYYQGYGYSLNVQDNWTCAPEYSKYLLYRELKTITLNKGFNSAEFISNDITRQLQQQTDLIIATGLEYRDRRETIDEWKPRNVATIVESETYKLFPCANNQTFSDNSDAIADEQSTWFNSFSCIAIKRPELYEKGRDINMMTDYDVTSDTFSTVDGGLLGSYIINEYNNTDGANMVLNILYTKENCDKLRDFFIAQEQYPEIWDSWNNDIDFEVTFDHYDSSHNIDTTRFLHMNRWSNGYMMEIEPSATDNIYNTRRSSLGSSEYRNPHLPNASGVGSRFSCLFLIRYFKENRDKFLENPNIKNGLTYGCIGKTTYSAEYSDDDVPVGRTADFITLYPNEIMPNSTDNSSLPPPITTNQTTTTLQFYKVGFDLHWTAMTTNAVTLYNGMQTYPNFYGETNNEKLSVTTYSNLPPQIPNQTLTDLHYNIVRYLGADNPKLNFDGQHFSFSDLHTSVNVGNTTVDGATIVDPQISDYNHTIPQYAEQVGTQSTAQSDIIYRINPIQDMTELCPALLPYMYSFPAFNISNGLGAGQQGDFFVRPFNQNLESYTPYDAKSGIFFEDMGYTQNTWSRSLWGLLGFSYEQFNNTNHINRLERVNGENVNRLKYITTNAQIVTSDTKNYATNDKGVPYFTDNIPTQYHLSLWNKNNHRQTRMSFFPQLNIKTQSIKIFANNYP